MNDVILERAHGHINEIENQLTTSTSIEAFAETLIDARINHMLTLNRKFLARNYQDALQYRTEIAAKVGKIETLRDELYAAENRDQLSEEILFLSVVVKQLELINHRLTNSISIFKDVMDTLITPEEKAELGVS